MSRLPLAALAVILSATSATAEDWGTISGQIVVTGSIPPLELLHAKGAPIKDANVCAAEDTYKDDLLIDKDSKGLANVFVYMVKAPKSIHPDAAKPEPATVIFDQKNCVFIPHAMVVLGGQTIEVISSDPIAHNTHTYPLKNTAMNFLVAGDTPAGKGTKVEYKLGETLPMKVTCDFHPWMAAYWMVVDHPYAAVTDKEGKFTITNLPTGKHEFRVWHERVGYLDRKYEVTVAAGDNALKTVEVPIAKLQGKK